ncbi:unnamed protein product, partial [Polarella glacialis]
MAINTSRTPRRTDEFMRLSTSTSEFVAPGSYDIKNKVVTESAIPFNSLQEKVLNPMSGTSKITPGPGAYLGQEVCHAESDAQGGAELPGASVASVVFKSKAKRMAPTTCGASPFVASSVEKNPGPGTYSEGAKFGAKKQMNLQPSLRPMQAEEHTPTVPSIPQTRFLPGQEPTTEASKADAANLVMRHTGEPRDMVGPGEYSPNSDHLTHRMMPSTTFHRTSGTARHLWEPSVALENTAPPRDVPGPGSYDVRNDNEGSMNCRGAAHKFLSKVPMAQDMEHPLKRLMPGPGSYEVSGEIEKMMKQLQERNVALGGDRYRFGSMTDRVGWTRDVNMPYTDAYHVANVPGPGHYSIPSSTFASDPKSDEAKHVLPGGAKKKFYGVHHPSIVLALQEAEGPLQAFNSTDDRPCNKPTEQTTPAPWQYRRDDSRGQSMSSDLKEKAKVGRKGVFGSCADRFHGSPLAGRDGLPDPNWDGSNMDDSGAPEMRSSFKSTAPRLVDISGSEAQVVKLGNQDTPAPGAYDIKEPNYRSPFRVPRQDHLSFGSSKTRFVDGKQDVFQGHQMPLTNPSSGIYDPQKAGSGHVVGAPRLKDKRKPLHVGCTSEEVGPGTYFFENSGSLLKKSFNVSTQ